MTGENVGASFASHSRLCHFALAAARPVRTASEAMQRPTRPDSAREILRSTFAVLLSTLVTLAALEVILRVADFRALRAGKSERSLVYRHDAELGWAPIPGSTSTVTNARTIHAKHNELGFRDIEFKRDGRPVLLFLGDSFVWGVDAEAEERFTDLLRARFSNYQTVNAGVSGFGTDQEYLLLQRIWRTVKPDVVVLIFCTDNDRADNQTSIRYDGYRKPLFVPSNDGLKLSGQPVPWSLQNYVSENWLVRHLWLARMAVAAYVELRYPRISVPDASEQLVDKISDFVAANNARFAVGLQSSDQKLMQHLSSEKIPFVTFDGAEAYPSDNGSHWTPAGNRAVADRLAEFLDKSKLTSR
jgi:lysophospholipase L1-like esterase